MTTQVPDMPAPFHCIDSRPVEPNPRTVRGTDFTWFNTCGANIIKTDYNTCSGDIKKHMNPWGILTQPKNIPFLEPQNPAQDPRILQDLRISRSSDPASDPPDPQILTTKN